MRLPRVPPGNARWIALSVGVLVLSVMVTAVSGALRLFGFPADETVARDAGRAVQATVVAAHSCGAPAAMETVRFTLDGREHEATFDGCGHSADERLDVLIGADTQVVRSADAATGSGHYGQRLGFLLLVLAGIAGGGFALLVLRGPRGTPLPVLGPFDPAGLGKLIARRTP